MAQNFHEFREKICLSENNTCLIHEIKNAKILFRSFSQKFTPTKIQTTYTVHAHAMHTVLLHVRIHMYIHITCWDAYTHTHTHVHTLLHVHTQGTRAHKHPHTIHACMHAYTSTYTHMYIHMYTIILTGYFHEV